MKKRQKVRLNDGFSGATVLLFADPIETDRSSGCVKLQCAEPGRSHLFHWVLKKDLEKELRGARE